MTAATDEWEARGGRIPLAGYEVFVVDIDEAGAGEREPLLVIHGFPTSSFDFHLVIDQLARDRRVVLFDMVGYGLSAKPDLAYTVDIQADVVVALTDRLGLDRISLLTHDFGDTVGGELLARQEEGRWPVEIVHRVLTNGSIYIQMAHLSAGQELLLSLPDQRLGDDAPMDTHTLAGGLAATLSPSSTVSAEELEGAAELAARSDGLSLLPRTIRYIEERRRSESRFTGAIEDHPSPLHVVWGADDPIAVVAMVDHLREARPDITAEILDGVGHFPMVESPDRFLAGAQRGLS
ncbi:MAG TPA: alpha/beta hydrolase [Acidimicrobiales bacterium]|nr:alpha/beta hydrolase [Acidimicrobiales bacterium]